MDGVPRIITLAPYTCHAPPPPPPLSLPSAECRQIKWVSVMPANVLYFLTLFVEEIAAVSEVAGACACSSTLARLHLCKQVKGVHLWLIAAPAPGAVHILQGSVTGLFFNRAVPALPVRVVPAALLSVAIRALQAAARSPLHRYPQVLLHCPRQDICSDVYESSLPCHFRFVAAK